MPASSILRAVTRAPALRATALLALGAFAVHQLRYLLVPDAHAAVGHAYLAAAPPLLTLLLAAALGRTLVAIAHGETGGRDLTWLGASGALLALHAGHNRRGGHEARLFTASLVRAGGAGQPHLVVAPAVLVWPASVKNVTLIGRLCPLHLTDS